MLCPSFKIFMAFMKKKKNSTKLEYKDESPPAWETSEFVMGFLASCFFLL